MITRTLSIIRSFTSVLATLMLMILLGAGVQTLNAAEVNGTRIAKKNNLAGVITDATTGKGIKGVPVSDGFNYTYTDRNGVYQMKADAHCRFVNYSTPAGYKVAINKTGNVAFYASTAGADGQSGADGDIIRRDFVLEKSGVDETDFTLLMISDPQCKFRWHVGRYENETIPDIRKAIDEAQAKGHYENVYAVTLGDETYDNHDRFPQMRAAESDIKIKGDNGVLPVFNTIGNHDHNYKCSDDDFLATALYSKWFGPTDYSFNRGNAHIIVMDNVISYGLGSEPCKYDAGFTSEQMKWLKQDIATVKDPSRTLVIFCTHIPFRSGSDKGGGNVNFDKYHDQVLKMLTVFHEAHLMIGHTHCPENYIHSQYICKGGQPIYEHIHAAVCGGWWYSNMCVDGSPNGYAFYEIRGNSMFDWVAKGTDLDYSYQMRVYDGNDVYSGPVKTFSWEPELKGCFIATVFNDDPDYWKLDFVYDGKTYPMMRVTEERMDWCAYSFHINVCHRLLTNDSWRSLRKHFWTVAAPGGDPAALKGWEIIATQTIPSSGVTHQYKCSSLQRGYEGFLMASDGTRKD